MVISLNEYKTYAGITNPTSDNKLQLLVDGANQLIEAYCNQGFSLKSVTKKLQCYGSEVMIPDMPIYQIDSVSYSSTGLLLAPSDYEVEPDIGIITILLPKPPQDKFGITVAYTHGFSDIPEPLKLAACEIVTYYLKREFSQGRSNSNESTTFIDYKVLPPQITAMLNLYRVL